MKVAVVVVGIGQWEEYTKPCVDSIVQHEPDAKLFVVDNGRFGYKASLDYHLIIALKILSYANAINRVYPFVDSYDWIVVLNNDVLCTAPFINQLKDMSTSSLYGNRLHMTHPRFDFGSPWVDGWMYAIPGEVLCSVGHWDSKFKNAAFEDADYSYRAIKKGFTIQKSDLPFTHLEISMRKNLENFSEERLFNLRYLISKHGLSKK